METSARANHQVTEAFGAVGECGAPEGRGRAAVPASASVGLRCAPSQQVTGGWTESGRVRA